MNVHYSHEEWRMIFSQRLQSGLSVRKWCEKNNFKYDTYKYWEKKIRRMDSEPESFPVTEQTFIELPPFSQELPATSESPSIEVRYHEFHVGIHKNADMGQVSGALRLLQSIC